MFYTCTMNPAIDLFISTDDYQPFIVNRSNEDEAQANGKGVNISFILKQLNINSRALGFIGGFTGEFIKEELNKAGIETDFIKVDNMTRINVFTQVMNEDAEYKLVNKGPEIEDVQIQKLLEQISQLTAEDILFVSGSNPRGVSDEVLLKIAQISKENQFKLVLDTSSGVVLDTLKYQPYCLKPNDEELAGWYNEENLTTDELHFYGRKLIDEGAQRVLLSLGENGCLYFDDQQTFQINAPKGDVVNTAGSGDTLLGTFIGLIETGTPTEEALKHAIAAASATAFTSGLTDFSNVEALKEELTIIKINKE